jgi:hypothetical protein
LNRIRHWLFDCIQTELGNGKDVGGDSHV